MLVEGTKRLEMIELAKTGITFCEVNDEPTDTIGTENEISEQGEGGSLPTEC